MNRTNIFEAKASKALKSIICIALLALFGCDNSSSSKGGDDNIVAPVEHPVSINGVLYEFDTSNATKTILGDSDAATNSTFLDVFSLSLEVNSSNSTFFPEYFAYSAESSVYLYELQTRRLHELYSFADDLFICDLKAQKVVNQKKLTEDSIVEIQESPSLLISTSSNSECAPNEELDYYNLKIEESFTETFENPEEAINEVSLSSLPSDADCKLVDRSVSLPDDRSYSAEIIDGIGLKIREGEYKSCDELLKPERELVTNTYPVLVGKLIAIDEALYSAQDVVVDVPNRQFGRLGYNRETQEIKFYIADKEEGETDRIPLWTQALESFSWNEDVYAPQISFTNNEYDVDSDFAVVENGWDVHLFSYLSLFDDDRLQDRTSSIENPIFVRTEPSADSIYSYSDIRSSIYTNGNMLLRDDDDIYFYEYEVEDAAASFVRSIDTSTSTFELTNHKSILAVKSSGAGQSLTNIEEGSGIESTLIPTTDRISLNSINGATLAINFVESDQDDNKVAMSQVYDEEFTPYFNDNLTNSLVAPLSDKQTEQQDFIIIRGASNPGNGILNNNLVFYLDLNQTVNESINIDTDQDKRLGEKIGEGKFIGTLDSDVAEVLSAEVLSDNHGLISIRPTLDSNDYRVYYFNPNLSYDEDFTAKPLLLVYDSAEQTD